MGKVRIIPVGGTERAFNTLNSILKRNDIEIPFALIMRGNKSEIEWSKKSSHLLTTNKVRHLVIDRVNDDVMRRVKALEVDAFIGVGVWRSILPPELFNASKYGYLSLHGSGLPEYRGFAAINWQIINNERCIKMHVFKMDQGIDSGPVMINDQGEPICFKVDIDNELHLKEIFAEYEKVHIEATHFIIDTLIENKLKLAPQNETEATYGCKRTPEDGEIIWSSSTNDLFNFIRAQSEPYEGAFTFYNGFKVHIHRTRIRKEFKNYTGRIPGRVVEICRASKSVIILTGDSALEILEVKVANSGLHETPDSVFNRMGIKCKSRVEAYLDQIDWHGESSLPTSGCSQ